MRKLLLLLLLLPAYSAKSQIGYEELYPEKQLKLNLQAAKSLAEQIFTAGFLAVHYKKIFKDSLAANYINAAFDIARKSADDKLMANALWWDAYCSSSATTRDEYDLCAYKANTLIAYAEQHNLLAPKIGANLILVDNNIHNNMVLAEKYGLAAKEVFDHWKKDTIGKDSIRLVMDGSLTHVYIHKKDGIKAAQYLLAIQDYAEQDLNQVLNIQASGILADMYIEWQQHQKQATQWLDKVYNYYKKTNQPSLLLARSFGLSWHHIADDKKLAIAYVKETENLMDSLHVNGLYLWYHLDIKRTLGLITTKQFVQSIDNNFNNRLFLPASWSAITKADLYLKVGELDSAGLYLSKAKKAGADSIAKAFVNYKSLLSRYYYSRKEYSKAIKELKEIAESGKAGNMGDVFALEGLAQCYYAMKDYKTSLQYEWLYNHAKDSLDRLNNIQDVALMELQKQKELQDSKLREQAELANQAAYRNRARLYGLLAIAVTILVIAGILFRNNRQRKKANVLLHQQKEELQNTFQTLKSTQSQLIQSEKMASLGELTAGIAHEIQNPLNFVNNFSDVNTELIDELKTELTVGNIQSANEIADTLKENEQKINHHGKRADAIVKGMLQHSRTSSGQKETTDINALADEYLRLAYHGLRAKDKSFNAKFETDFDNGIGKINVVAQDIGRVLLNLINNAFYAVGEKKKLVADARPDDPRLNDSVGQAVGREYKPTVNVTTKKINGRIEIRVTDNGNGIPLKVVDKIFQPFFTTKPTGQGTGLGLSLAYDIITKGHSGKLRVETKEGQGATFIIELPMT